MGDIITAQLENPSPSFFEISGSFRRGGGWSIEIPPLPDPDSFIDSARYILPQAIEDCASAKAMQDRKVVQVVPNIISFDNTYQGRKIKPGAQGATSDKSDIFIISLSLDRLTSAIQQYPQTHWKVDALGVILHEIYEMDDILLSKSGRLSHLPLGHPNYSISEAEGTANQKALSALQRYLGADYSMDSHGIFYLDIL